MKVTFTDPTTSSCFVAEVPPTITASECVQALKQEGHLGKHDYVLVVNGTTMSPGQTLGAAGVVDGDTAAILKLDRGARSRHSAPVN